MKKMFLFVPVCALMFSCEKEEKEQIAQNGTTERISVERIDLNQPDQSMGGDRENLAYETLHCPMNDEEKAGLAQNWTGKKCSIGNLDDCWNDANTRCEKRTTVFDNILTTYLTSEEIDIFWNKTYDEQFVRDNWDFFMAAYNAQELKHPDEIISLNFR